MYRISRPAQPFFPKRIARLGFAAAQCGGFSSGEFAAIFRSTAVGYIARTRRIRCRLFGCSNHMLTLRIGVYMSKFRLPALNSLRAFEAAARHQSIKKACDELHVTHAAVSRHIQKLEQQLGRDLFERHHRKIVLNEAGELLLGAVTVGFSHIQRAISQWSANQNSERLVISVDPDFAALWLVPRLAEFHAIVPNTLVEILAEKGLDTLQDSRMDCAIQYADAGLDLENGEVLFRSHLFPVCAPDSALLTPPRSLEDLRHHTLLHDRSITEWQEYLLSCSTAIDLDVSSGLMFSATALCLDAASRGQGIAIGDDFLAEMHLMEGRLVRPFESAFLSKNAYYFVIPKKATLHPAVDAFRAWLRESICRFPEPAVHFPSPRRTDR
jgi:LysR family transcriptional regulator, glycine cleavage system transcriptional activator